MNPPSHSKKPDESGSLLLPGIDSYPDARSNRLQPVYVTEPENSPPGSDSDRRPGPDDRALAGQRAPHRLLGAGIGEDDLPDAALDRLERRFDLDDHPALGGGERAAPVGPRRSPRINVDRRPCRPADPGCRRRRAALRAELDRQFERQLVAIDVDRRALLDASAGGVSTGRYPLSSSSRISVVSICSIVPAWSSRSTFGLPSSMPRSTGLRRPVAIRPSIPLSPTALTPAAWKLPTSRLVDLAAVGHQHRVDRLAVGVAGDPALVVGDHPRRHAERRAERAELGVAAVDDDHGRLFELGQIGSELGIRRLPIAAPPPILMTT